ncbi:MAG: hypothetical protein JWM05_946 [Acidimicrobiales bacterium]|nr:hypothetical protein [Acidimicrobiales bacterium]
MINLRYHIVSITAIFLALGIGVALGGSFLDSYTVNQLNSNISSAEGRISNTNAENRRLRASIDRADARDKALTLLASQQLVKGRLTDTPVLVIATDGVDKPSLDGLRAMLVGAGANFRGTLVLTDKLKLDAAATTDLGDALGVKSRSETAVRNALVQRLAAALTTAGTSAGGSGSGSSTTTTRPKGATTTRPGSGATTTAPAPTTAVPVPTTTAPGPTTARTPRSTTSTTRPRSATPTAEPAVITALRNLGFVKYQPPDGGSADDPILTTTGYRFVIVSGTDVVLPDSQLILPTLRAMTESGGTLPVVVASADTADDPEEVRTAVVGPIREDAALTSAVSTVDDLETFSGLLATVLAVQNLDSDVHGHYGEGTKATALLPIP